MATVKRKSHKERTREMINRLVEATADSLHEYGYHGSSVAKIIAKAGVSKGAWSHHFSSKKELIVKTAEVMLAESIERGKNALQLLNYVDEEERLPAIIDYFWENLKQGKRRDVWMEVYVVARTDTDLHELLSPVVQNFHDTLNAFWREYFVVIDDSGASVETVMNLMLFITRGMAVQSILIKDDEYYIVFRDQWVRMLKPIVKIKLPEAR